MNNHLTNRGVWVRINRYKGETVEGWLIGEIPQGLLIALDKDLKDLRLVSEYYSISYNHENKLSTLSIENATEVRDELQAISEAISVPMKNAISRTKFDKLHQFCHHSAELSWQIRQGEHEAFQGIDSEPRGELMGFLLAQVDRSTALHREVYETFEDCGLTAILDEFGSRLARLPAEFTIPAYDLEFSSREEITTALESARDKHWTGQRHSALLEAAEETRMRLILEAVKKRDHKNDTESKKFDDSTPFSRWFGPSLRVLAGTGLAAANAAVGVTAGITATITTLGSLGVPTYVGVATSIYTGLSQVADGLEKIGRCR